MSRWCKFYVRLWNASSDNDIRFDDLVNYLDQLGFRKCGGDGGSHRKLKHQDCLGLLDLQPRHDGKAKSYQLNQVRLVLETYTGVDKDAWLEGRA